ncbi:hypothetical protein [Vineibacter terrae]|uniref:hypothetical protein n=1 Tax=Vineibacter terrae TaxID=2586908 RepID=UPI002E354358|nr:hypothetical protein [Vineibacter terrae]HEX2885179.1 hypothetical protein [Vineibacter terrae]
MRLLGSESRIRSQPSAGDKPDPVLTARNGIARHEFVIISGHVYGMVQWMPGKRGRVVPNPAVSARTAAPEAAIRRAARSPLGAIVARPWVDPVALGALRRWFFPLSRLWAAANAAEGDVERFFAEPGAPADGAWSRRVIGPVLRRHEMARLRAANERARWESAAFGPDPIPPEALGRLDDVRRGAASRHLATRGLLYPLLYSHRVPLAAWAVPAPATMQAAYGAGLDDAAAIYNVPTFMPHIEVSHPAARPSVTEWWLRFATPHGPLAARPGCETVYARVIEPEGLAPGAPTVIAGNGLCVESDLLTNSIDPGAVLAPLGFRVVEVVSPYHGLRTQAGTYGGEPFFAAAPLGTLDLIAGQTLETAVLIDWCRRQFSGPVAVGGISMSSFVAQQVATRCRDWPQRLRPDALLLVSHSGRIEEVTFAGSLIRALGLTTWLRAAGWTRQSLMRWEGLLNPSGAPGLPPERIVSILGVADRLLPFETGQEVARAWSLPAENVFELNVGHLAMPVALMRDDRPLLRLKAIMEGPAVVS